MRKLTKVTANVVNAELYAGESSRSSSSLYSVAGTTSYQNVNNAKVTQFYANHDYSDRSHFNNNHSQCTDMIIYDAKQDARSKGATEVDVFINGVSRGTYSVN